VAGLLLVPVEAWAYVGPGAGFAFVTSFFLLLTTSLLVLLALLTWPLRMIWRLVKRKRPPKPPLVKRVVVLGLDGLDPRTVRRLTDQGQLPNFQRVAKLGGGMGELATTCPAISPVAWSTFATGVDPSRHGIFDFMAPDRRRYRPRLSSTEFLPPRRILRLGRFQLPLSKPRLRNLRRAVPFWRLLGQYGVQSSILRVPITFPPDAFEGTMLSAMCVPDLLGTQGSFTYFTSEEVDEERIGGRAIRVNVEQGRVRTDLPGPPHPLRPQGPETRAALQLRLNPGEKGAQLRIGGERITLEVGRFSSWVRVPFRFAPGLSLRGICRFLLTGVDPLRLYVSPINIDPTRPSLPIAHPFVFSVFLGKLIGRYATLGLAEDTWALNEGVLDRQAFLDQTQLTHTEREQMFFEMLRRTRRGVLTCVFDATDRIQHMFMRERSSSEDPHATAIEAVYRQMDQMLGRLLETVDFEDPRNLLLILSDHGFAPFERGVNLNTWLVEQGYMTLEEGHTSPGEYLEGVDWSATRAYAIGLSGLYLNVKGREGGGIVPHNETASLSAELADRLEHLADPESDTAPIRRVFITRKIYDGPFLDDAPDLIIGYEEGYRASWETARGMGGQGVVVDNTRHWSGDHCIDPELVPGVLLSSRPLRLTGAKIGDIAPTLLQLFGIPQPRHMTGQSLLVDGDAR
jgi:predicted AlkP superfamily phosphohydrolase/phosphomutase